MNAPIPELRRPIAQTNEHPVHISLVKEPLYSGKQASVPVLELLAALKKYHQARDFSHQERFGTPDIQSRRALSELGRVQESLQALTAETGVGEEFMIEASLNVRVAPVTGSPDRLSSPVLLNGI